MGVMHAGSADCRVVGQLCHPGKVTAIAVYGDRRWSVGGSNSNSTILEWDANGHVIAQINTSNAGAAKHCSLSRMSVHCEAPGLEEAHRLVGLYWHCCSTCAVACKGVEH